jgi:predicted  nucleic acid-binding Zn-ribbon protein
MDGRSLGIARRFACRSRSLPARALRVLHSVHARSEIERGSGFGSGVGVPVSLRPGRSGCRDGARWRLAQSSRASFIPGATPRSMTCRRSRPSRAAGCGGAVSGAGTSGRRPSDPRAAGSGCPACDRQRKRGPRTVGRERSLQASHPELAAEWHPTRNRELNPADVSPGSKHRAWWCCAACGHQWQAAVHNRARGSGCPVCGLKRRARTQSEVEPARSLAVRHLEIAAELHRQRNPGIDPLGLGARSSLKLWWRCASCGHEWKTAVSTRTDGSGCPACYESRCRYRSSGLTVDWTAGRRST